MAIFTSSKGLPFEEAFYLALRWAREFSEDEIPGAFTIASIVEALMVDGE